MKKTNLVLDTNILIYGINEDSKYFQQVRAVLDNSHYSFFITTKTVTEFVSVLSKLGRYDIIEQELPKILRQFTIIYSSKKSIQVFKGLVEKYKPVGNRVFDIEIVSMMLAKKIKKLFSINKKDFIAIDEITLLVND